MAKLPNYYKVSIDGLAVKLEPIYEELVEVCRCKDCKYSFKNNGHSKKGCPINDASIWMDDDDFCSHGERRDGE